MARDVPNRYQGLPRRTPDMLYRIVGKFYRGAVSHRPIIDARKQDAERAWRLMRETGETEPLRQALWVLFCEFHFYVTCWLQIELALYRLSRQPETAAFAEVMERFRTDLERHLDARHALEDTDGAVAAQFARFGPDMACVPDDAYWLEGTRFTVNDESFAALHRLYDAIQEKRRELAAG